MVKSELIPIVEDSSEKSIFKHQDKTLIVFCYEPKGTISTNLILLDFLSKSSYILNILSSVFFQSATSDRNLIRQIYYKFYFLLFKQNFLFYIKTET